MKTDECREAWERLRVEILQRIEVIDKETPWQDKEPAWWLKMQDVATILRQDA